jgi:hypothetical protein
MHLDVAMDDKTDFALHQPVAVRRAKLPLDHALVHRLVRSNLAAYTRPIIW